VKRQIPSPHLLARWVEVEVEAVDGVDLGKASVANAPIDGAAKTALFL
jgi:hypothetical protein